MPKRTAQPVDFRFTLICRGIETHVLKTAPEEWLKTTIETSRSLDQQGIIRQLTTPMSYPFDGATILRNEYYNHGFHLANVVLKVDKFNPASNVWNYQTIFTGLLDFSQFDDQKDKVQIVALRNDISANIDAYKDTKYSIPVDVDAAITINLTPLTLKEKAILTLQNNNFYNANAFLGLTIAQNTQNSVNASVFTEDGEYVPNPDWPNSPHYFYASLAGGNMSIRAIFSIGARTYNNVRYTLALYKQDGSVVKTLYTYLETRSGYNTVDIYFDQTFVINIAVGERLFLYGSVTAQVDGTGFTYGAGNTGELDLQYDTTSPTSQCKAVPLKYVFDQLIAKMNLSTPYPTQSVLLTQNQTLSRIYLTCSDAIRKTLVGQLYQAGDTLQNGGQFIAQGDTITYNGKDYNTGQYFNYAIGQDSFTTASGNGFVRQTGSAPSLVLTWTDFFKSVRAWMGGQSGFGVADGTAMLEDLTAFFRNVMIADLGSDIIWKGLEPATDYLYNTVKVGYEDKQYNSINGSLEVNSTQYYSTYALKPVKELDLICPIRCDAYGIEEVRIQPVDSSSSKSDNDVFGIYIDALPQQDGTYNPERVNGYNWSGVDSGYYNWQLSPKENLLRGGAYLHSLFAALRGYKLNFVSALKNSSLRISGQYMPVVIENASIDIASLPDPLFIPQLVSIGVRGTDTMQALIDAAPYGYVQFEYRGVIIKGYLLDAITDQGKKSSQDFKLLLTPDNILGMLVH